MPSFIARFPSSFNSSRPVRSSRDVRANSQAASQVGKATPSGAPPPQGGFPPIAFPFLALAAAAPIYGYQKSQQEIAAARKKYEEDIKAGRVAPPAARTKA